MNGILGVLVTVVLTIHDNEWRLGPDESVTRTFESCDCQIRVSNRWLIASPVISKIAAHQREITRTAFEVGVQAAED